MVDLRVVPGILFALVALFTLVAAPAALAEVTVSFPLQGYYRPGRVMPVVVQGESAALLAAGAVPTEVIGETRDGVTVPWLPLATVRNPRVVAGGVERPIDQPLFELGDDERLIGVGQGLDVSRVAVLYPGDALIPISIDATNADPAWQWETFDAVVLDAAPDADAIGELLGAGVAVAVASEARPVERWPWRRVGDVWVVGPPARVPDQLVMPQAYLPVQAWAPGRSGGYRRQVVVLAAIGSIVLLALSLWRDRRTALAAVAAVAVFAAGAHLWARGRGVVVEREGTIVVATDGLGVRDRWTWLTALQAAAHDVPLDARPVVASLRHAATTDLRVTVPPDGPPVFQFALRPGLVLALRDRTVVTDADGRDIIRDAAGGGALMPFVRSAYLVPGTSVVGASVPAADDDHLGHLVLRYQRQE